MYERSISFSLKKYEKFSSEITSFIKSETFCLENSQSSKSQILSISSKSQILFLILAFAWLVICKSEK